MEDDEEPIIPHILGVLLGLIVQGFMMTFGSVLFLVLLGVL